MNSINNDKEKLDSYIKNGFEAIEEMSLIHQGTIKKIFDNMTDNLLRQFYEIYHLYNMKNLPCVYFIYNKATNLTKIGSTDNPINRLRQLSSTFRTHFGIDDALELIAVLYVTSGENIKLEHMLHKKYAEYNVHGEWFKLSKEQINCEINIDVYVNEWSISLYDDFKINYPEKYLPSDDFIIHLMSFEKVKEELLESTHSLINEDPKCSEQYYRAHYLIEKRLKDKIFEKFNKDVSDSLISFNDFLEEKMTTRSSSLAIYTLLRKEQISIKALNLSLDDPIEIHEHRIGFGDEAYSFEDVANKNINEYLSSYNL